MIHYGFSHNKVKGFGLSQNKADTLWLFTYQNERFRLLIEQGGHVMASRIMKMTSYNFSRNEMKRGLDFHITHISNLHILT